MEIKVNIVTTDHVEDYVATIVLHWSHAPHKKYTLGYEVPRYPGHHHIQYQLQKGKGGQHHPVPQPGHIVILLLTKNCLERAVSGIDTAHHGSEEMSTITKQEAEADKPKTS